VQPTGVGRLVPGTCRIMLFLGQNQNKVPVELTRALQPFGAAVEYLSISGSGPNAVDFHIAFYIGHLAQKHPGAKFTIVSRDTGFDPLVRHLSDTLKIRCGRIKALPVHAASKVVAAAPSVPAVADGQGTAPASAQAAATAPAVHPAGGNVVTLKPAAVAAVAQPIEAVSPAVPVVPAAPTPAKRAKDVEVTVLPAPAPTPAPKPKPKPKPKPVTADVATFTDQVIDRLKGMKHAKPATLKTLTSSLNAWATPAPGVRVVPQVIASLKERKLISVEGTKVSYRLK